MSENGAERRNEPRHQASGRIEFAVQVSSRVVFQGELLDLSRSGFRARHERTSLSTGEEVRYSYPGGSGSAKVMWSRILGGKVESGFLVV
jgi:PilZ domain-containing protein